MPRPQQLPVGAALVSWWKQDDKSRKRALNMRDLFKVMGYDVELMELDGNNSWEQSEKTEAFETYSRWADVHDGQDKLLLFCYVGHGMILFDDDELYELHGAAGEDCGADNQDSFSITAIQRDARDHRDSHFVFILECCNGDYLADLPLPMPTPQFIEVIAAGKGEISEQAARSWTRRLYENLKTERGPLTVLQRHSMIEDGEEGFYARICGAGVGGSVILGDLENSRVQGFMWNTPGGEGLPDFALISEDNVEDEDLEE